MYHIRIMPTQLDLNYPAILQTFGGHVMKERTESRAFLAWFLENYYRLDETELQDCICDGPYDKGIDGVYVNGQLAQVDVLQCRIVKSEKTLGDTALKEFAGTLSQLRDPDGVRHLQTTTKNKELAGLLADKEIAKRIADGYEVRGVFITNARRDHNAIDFLKITPGLVLYDEPELQKSYVPIDKVAPISTEVGFDLTSVPFIEYPIGSELKMIIAPIAAEELVAMDGIANGELFAWNVRQWLGRKTKVNKDIEKSIGNVVEHKYFPAFHNGLTVLCKKLDLDGDKVTISGYAVVNGCQSLTGLHENKNKITSDLRILTKFIEISPDSDLALKITDHTNNQNGTTHRDLQSNNPIQTRLQSEIHRRYAGDVYYRIKRGEHPEWDSDKVIENELAARILLAFDLKEPWSCHQAYKLFDELHAAIFGRPEVDADRVVAVHAVYQSVLESLKLITNEAFGGYGLTRFLMLYLVRKTLETDETGSAFCQDPMTLLKQPDGWARLQHCIGKLAASLVRFVDNEMKRRETAGDFFDYKRQLKTPRPVADLRSTVISQYQVVVDAGYLPSFSDDWQTSAAMFATAPLSEAATE